MITTCNVALMEGVVKWGLLSESNEISSAEECLVAVTTIWRLHVQMLTLKGGVRLMITKRNVEWGLIIYITYSGGAIWVRCH